MNKEITNRILLNGKITKSEKIWLSSIKGLYKLCTKNPIKFINRALINVAPLIKIKQLKRKRKILQEFPFIIKKKNRISFIVRFFLHKIKNKLETKISKRLTTDFIFAAQNTGVHINEKKSLYEYAFIKKKYFYYRWF